MEGGTLNSSLAAQVQLLTSELHQQNEQILSLLERLSKGKANTTGIPKQKTSKKTQQPSLPIFVLARKSQLNLNRSRTSLPIGRSNTVSRSVSPSKTEVRCASCSKLRPHHTPANMTVKESYWKNRPMAKPHYQTNISKLRKLSGKLLPKISRQFLFRTRNKALNLHDRGRWTNPEY